MTVPNKSEWTSAFNEIFEELSERDLPASSFSSFEANNPLQITTKGEALFQCPKCSRYWGSSNGLIKFTYRLSFNNTTREGFGDVTLWAFGQKCKKCPSCPFVPAKFTGDSIDDALHKLLLKVKEKFYECGSGQFGWNSGQCGGNSGQSGGDGHSHAQDRKGPHDSKRCQACQLGVCQSSISSNQSHSYRRGPDIGSGPVPRSRRIRFCLSFADEQ